MIRRALFQVGWHLHRLLYRLTGGRASGAGTLVRAHRAAAAEREGLWSRIVAWNPTYRRYQERAGREVPVVVLEPRADA